jgi:TolB-like protein
MVDDGYPTFEIKKSSDVEDRREQIIQTSNAREVSRESFEFGTRHAARIFDYLTNAFDQDYMTKRLARDDSGWRTLGDIANDMRISTSIVYSKKKNQLSPPVQELLQRGLIERRFYQNERGRGGEVMRFRIAYDNELVRNFIDVKIKHGSINQSKASKTFVEESATGLNLVLDRHRIAVLPFTNISQNSADEFFADGMTEEMVSAISKIDGLKVIARTSVMSYKVEQKTKGIVDIARELAVGTILEGSVRKVDDKLRIAVALIDCSSGENLWTDEYDGVVKDVFAIQSVVARRVAESLELKLLKGRYHWYQRTVEDISKAISYYRLTIAKDPKYALAYCGLADSYVASSVYEICSYREADTKIREYCSKAIGIDNNLAEAHTTMMAISGNLSKVEREFERAISINPNYSLAYNWHAQILGCSDKFDQAYLECEKAREIDPLSPTTGWTAGFVNFHTRRFGDSLREFENLLEIYPHYMPAILWQGLVYISMSKFETGIEKIRQTMGELPVSSAALAYAYARAGMEAEGRDSIEQLEHSARDSHDAATIASLYFALNNYEKGKEWVDKVDRIEILNLATCWCQTLYPWFLDLKYDKRFIPELWLHRRDE